MIDHSALRHLYLGGHVERVAAAVKAHRARTTAFAAHIQKPGVHTGNTSADDHVRSQAEIVADLAEVARSINERTFTRAEPVLIQAALRYLLTRGIYQAASACAVDSSAPPDSRGAALGVLDYLRSAIAAPAFDLSKPSDRALFDGLFRPMVSAGLMDSSDFSALENLQTVERPAWMQVGQRELDHGDILVALGHRWEDLTAPTPGREPPPAPEKINP